MSRNRELQRKLRYAKAMKTNRRIPYWILQRSGQKQRYNNKQHHWARNHLKL